MYAYRRRGARVGNGNVIIYREREIKRARERCLLKVFLATLPGGVINFAPFWPGGV